MQVRHGVCNACGARYKLPASFAHDRAKCKQCGGVVEIGAPVADAPPAKAGAPPVPASKPARPARPGAQAPGKPAAAATPAPKQAPAAPSMKEKLLARKQGEHGGVVKPKHEGEAAAAAAEAASFLRERREHHGRGAGARRGRSSARHSTRRPRGKGKGKGEESEGDEPNEHRQLKKASPVPLIAAGVFVLLAVAMFFFKDALLGDDAEAGEGNTAAVDDSPDPTASWPEEERMMTLRERQAILWTEGKDPLIVAIVDALDSEGLEISREPVRTYVDDLAKTWLREEDNSHLRTRDRFVAATLPASLENHVAPHREYVQARLAEVEARKAAIESGEALPESDPANVDLAALPDLPRFVGTTDEEWDEIHGLVENLIDPYVRGGFNKPLKALLGYHRKVFPPVMNHFKALDFSLEDSVKAGLQINRYLEQATGGHISTGWKDGVAPDDEWFNKRVVVAWYKGIAKVLEDDVQWAGMLKVDLDKIPDPAGLTAPKDDLDAALDELDVD